MDSKGGSKSNLRTAGKFQEGRRGLKRGRDKNSERVRSVRNRDEATVESSAKPR